MNVTVVYNPKSGSALEPRELKKRCKQAGILVTRLVAIDDGFERRLAAPIRNGETIAVVGGDGTVSAVAGQVVGTSAVLAPLPGGTLNNFTKDLGIPQNLDEALARLAKARTQRIDVGEVNGTVFINNAGVGIYPQTLRAREQHEDTMGKWPAAVVASVRAFVRLRPLRLTIDGVTRKTPFVFVGNNRYRLDSVGLTERSRLDEGVLTVFVARTSSRLTLLKVALYALLGIASSLDEFDEYHPTSLTIDTRRPTLSVSHDGEVAKMTAPIEYQIRKKALKIR